MENACGEFVLKEVPVRFSCDNRNQKITTQRESGSIKLPVRQQWTAD